MSRIFITCCVLFVFTVSAMSQSRKALPTERERLAIIESYVGEVDRFIKLQAKSARIFANVAPYNEADRWREFKTKSERDKAGAGDNLNENAYVWSKEGKIVGANFTLQSPSGDWVNFVMYYFREDGTLAKVHAELNGFYGDLSVIRDSVYSPNGRLLRSKSKYLDLHSRKPAKPTSDFVDELHPVYRRVTDLPFYKLL